MKKAVTTRAVMKRAVVKGEETRAVMKILKSKR